MNVAVRMSGSASQRRSQVIGDSAGGGLVLTLLHALRDAGEALPAGAVLISPLLDLTASGTSLTERASLDPVFTPDARCSATRLRYCLMSRSTG